MILTNEAQLKKILASGEKCSHKRYVVSKVTKINSAVTLHTVKPRDSGLVAMCQHY